MSSCLLQRTTRSQSLTDTGQIYFQSCKRILEEMYATDTLIRASQSSQEGPVRLQASTDFGLAHIVPLMARYSRANQEVKFDFSLTSSLPNLIEGRLDLAIWVTSKLADSNFIFTPLGEVATVYCASPDYIREKGAPEHADQLSEHRLLSAEPDPAEAFEEQVATSQLMVRTKEVASATQAAVCGMGIAMLPSYVAAEQMRKGSLVRVLPELEADTQTVYAMYYSRKFICRNVRCWLDFLKVQVPRRLAADRKTISSSAVRAGNWRCPGVS